MTTWTARRPWLMPIVRRYVDYRLRRAFDEVLVAGLDDARACLARGPAIIAANHVAWWDPLLAIALDARLGTEGYALMDADNLARLWFFGAVGAVPLRRSSPRDALADLGAAAQKLDGAGRALWIYPQGRQRPAHARPLGLSPGVAWLAERTGVPTLPLSVSYLYREDPVPAVFASFGAPLRFTSRRAFLADLEASLVRGLDHNDEAQAGRGAAHVPLLARRRASALPLGARLLELPKASSGATKGPRSGSPEVRTDEGTKSRLGLERAARGGSHA